MGRFLNDLTGKQFERLLVVKYLGRKNHSSFWLCLCDCGNKIKVASAGLNSGGTKSCGCYRSDRMKKLTFKHGERGGILRPNISPEYRAWSNMRSRCLNPTDKAYNYYGKRGIRVCDRWIDSFDNFLEDMGRKRTQRHSLDRLDGDGPYSPENCRWATWKQQARNRRNNRQCGSFRTLIEACEHHGIPYKTVKSRIQKGWRIDDAILRPIDERRQSTQRNIRKTK